MIATSGEVVWAARYDSFGNAVIDVEDVTNNLGFPGQYFDTESGLYYNWNRYYDPALGRYVQSDPLGFDAGMNFYVYANGNPVNLVDPMGLHTGGYGGPGHGDGGLDEMGSESKETRGEEGGDGWYNAQIGSTNHRETQNVQNDIRRHGGSVTYKPGKKPDHQNERMWADPRHAAIMRAQGYLNPFESAAPNPKNNVENRPNPPGLDVNLKPTNRISRFLSDVIEKIKSPDTWAFGLSLADLGNAFLGVPKTHTEIALRVVGGVTDVTTMMSIGVPDPHADQVQKKGIGLATSGVGLGCALAAPTPLGVGIGLISVTLSWNDLASEFTEEIEAGRDFNQGYCNNNRCR
jgi:RHS repeat-associated protein